VTIVVAIRLLKHGYDLNLGVCTLYVLDMSMCTEYIPCFLRSVLILGTAQCLDGAKTM